MVPLHHDVSVNYNLVVHIQKLNSYSLHPLCPTPPFPVLPPNALNLPQFRPLPHLPSANAQVHDRLERHQFDKEMDSSMEDIHSLCGSDSLSSVSLFTHLFIYSFHRPFPFHPLWKLLCKSCLNLILFLLCFVLFSLPLWINLHDCLVFSSFSSLKGSSP